MEKNNGYIYIRTHPAYDEEDVSKLGKAGNIPDRDSQYATGEIKRGYFKLVIEILAEQLHTASSVEKILQRYFLKYHVKYDAGNEFYKNKIIDEIIPFLSSTNIKFKILSKNDVEKLIRVERIKKALHTINIFVKKWKKHKLQKNTKIEKNENDLRNELQELYIVDIINELKKYKKVFLKAPTGFGKTHIYYKIIKRMNFKRILFLTPRILLNEQLTENKYSFYIANDNFKIIHFSSFDSKEKNKLIKEYSENKKKFLMTSCYQSEKKLLELIKQYNLKFDCVIFDEAHYITTWSESDNINEFLTNNELCDYRFYGSATPTENIEINQLIYGKIIEKIKVYELINLELLCNIETIVKQLNNKKSEYHNLKDLIINSITTYKKRKGIVYVNDCKNAQNLYDLMKKQSDINVYIYVSKNVNVENEEDTNIKSFEKDMKPCIIICVGKIGYGYDNDYIDFVCLGDPRQSDIDIRQIIGRGLRWKKNIYPDKILHLLIPLYKDQFNNYSKNEHLKKYLDYIIGECGQDIIIKKDGSGVVQSENKKISEKDGKKYDGESIPIEILNEYCTTGYNKFSDFMKFLRKNKIFNEIEYNELRELQTWIPGTGHIQEKYPKFCFRDIHPNNRDYYWNKKDALHAYNICNDKVIESIGKEKYRRYTFREKIKKIHELDNKIPDINFDLYYPK
jgi:superfamily II DNA or RNA helicase